jgi:hypothetical protein
MIPRLGRPASAPVAVVVCGAGGRDDSTTAYRLDGSRLNLPSRDTDQLPTGSSPSRTFDGLRAPASTGLVRPPARRQAKADPKRRGSQDHGLDHTFCREAVSARPYCPACNCGPKVPDFLKEVAAQNSLLDHDYFSSTGLRIRGYTLDDAARGLLHPRNWRQRLTGGAVVVAFLLPADAITNSHVIPGTLLLGGLLQVYGPLCLPDLATATSALYMRLGLDYARHVAGQQINQVHGFANCRRHGPQVAGFTGLTDYYQTLELVLGLPLAPSPI